MKLGKNVVSAIARTFCDTLIENKYSCGFYATAEYIEENFGDIDEYLSNLIEAVLYDLKNK